MDVPKEVIAHDFKIARSVLEKIAEVSAGRVSAVSRVGAVTVEPAGDAVVVNLGLTVDHKAVYPDVASLVQQSVVDAIKSMTDLKVRAVNINIERLDFSEK